MSAFASLKAVAAYSPQARALFARLATPPAPARAAAYDAVIRALLAAGVWGKLDALYLFAAADEATALTNLRQSSYGATAVNAPAFTADRGFTGDATKAIDSGFNISTAGGNFAQNSATLFGWVLQSAAYNGSFAGTMNTSAVFLVARDTSNQSQSRINSNSNVTLFSNADGAGLFASSRTASNLVTAYKDGVPLDTDTTSSAALANTTLGFLGATGDAYPGMITAGGFGAALNNAEHLALYNTIHGYLQAVGAVT